MCLCLRIISICYFNMYLTLRYTLITFSNPRITLSNYWISCSYICLSLCSNKSTALNISIRLGNNLIGLLYLYLCLCIDSCCSNLCLRLSNYLVCLFNTRLCLSITTISCFNLSLSLSIGCNAYIPYPSICLCKSSIDIFYLTLCLRINPISLYA